MIVIERMEEIVDELGRRAADGTLPHVITQKADILGDSVEYEVIDDCTVYTMRVTGKDLSFSRRLPAGMQDKLDPSEQIEAFVRATDQILKGASNV